MQSWQIALAAVLPAALVIACILHLICYRHSPRESNPQEVIHETRSNYCGGFRTLRETSPYPNQKHSNRASSAWRNSYSHHYPMQAFDWSNHPPLISEAVEHGWFTFGFTKTCIPSCPTNLRGLYSRISHGEAVEPEISWEIGSGVDHLQKIRLNPGLPTWKNTNLFPPVQSVRTALPLPGPPLGPSSFPQEAYFEITILALAENRERVGSLCSSKRFEEDEDVKLISQPSNSEYHVQHMSSEMTPTNFNANFKGVVAAKRSPRCSSKGLDIGNKDTAFQLNSMDHSMIPQVISVGLAVGGTALYRLPGCEPGSVGFHSTGFVFLNGIAHLNGDQNQTKPGSAKRAWGAVNTVIGCGFDPSKRRVFYTLNGEQVYTLTCNSDEFSHPLYPTIAANYDVTVLANFGQSWFQYLPANDQRVADPCFKRLLSSPEKLPSGPIYEDSDDLFSMRIETQWLGNQGCPSSQDLQHKPLPSDTESDLFEIPIDCNIK